MASWTEQRVAKLRELYGLGLSGGEIAARLGGLEHCADGGRNAVIGQIHRLGLTGRVRIARTKPAQKQKAPNRILQARANAKPKPAALEEEDTEEIEIDGEIGQPKEFELAIPLSQRRSLLQLTDETCRFPVGDPRDKDFFFCGAAPLEAKIYCGPHCRMAYDSAATRRLRNRAGSKQGN